ncbi:hypothetical protein ACLB2K_023050 [Fragaria x ananassa]
MSQSLRFMAVVFKGSVRKQGEEDHGIYWVKSDCGVDMDELVEGCTWFARHGGRRNRWLLEGGSTKILGSGCGLGSLGLGLGSPQNKLKLEAQFESKVKKIMASTRLNLMVVSTWMNWLKVAHGLQGMVAGLLGGRRNRWLLEGGSTKIS